MIGYLVLLYLKRCFKKKKCPFSFCSFSAVSEIDVLRHGRSIHTKEELFPCSYCDQNFSSYKVVMAHEKKHEDITKKRCQECKSFCGKANPHKCKVSKKWKCLFIVLSITSEEKDYLKCSTCFQKQSLNLCTNEYSFFTILLITICVALKSSFINHNYA